MHIIGIFLCSKIINYLLVVEGELKANVGRNSIKHVTYAISFFVGIYVHVLPGFFLGFGWYLAFENKIIPSG